MVEQIIKKSQFEERGTLFETGAPVTCSVSIDKVIAVGFGDGSLRLYKPDAEPVVVHAHNGVILSIAANDSHIITGGQDGLFLKKSLNGEIEEIYNFGTQWVDNVAAYEDMFLCSSGKNVYIWSGDNNKPKLLEHQSTIGGIAIDQNGRRIAVSCYGGVTLWRYEKNKWKSSKFAWKGSHSKVGFSPDGKYIVTTMQENELHAWRIRDKASFAMSGYPSKVKSFTWAGDNPYLVTAGAREAICWPFDGKEGPRGRTPLCIASGGQENATYVETLPGEKAIFAGFKNGMVLLSELSENPNDVLIQSPTGSEISNISISPDRSHILVGDIKGKVLWSPLWE